VPNVGVQDCFSGCNVFVRLQFIIQVFFFFQRNINVRTDGQAYVCGLSNFSSCSLPLLIF
jgi:hypothetical protein